MCTVTFIARRNGYALGMNRDEKLTRVAGLPPARRSIGGREVLSPGEPGGGTWIGVNDKGATFALINWYSTPARVGEKVVSRGAVVRSILAAGSPSDADEALVPSSLDRVNPFRLIGIFPTRRAVLEWRWDLERLERFANAWRTRIWISSGFDEPGAQRIRSRTFGKARRQDSRGSLGWLRRLHRSHGPGRGPYSICMHRADAATVSYTEVTVADGMAIMRFSPGAPCCTSPSPALSLRLRS